MEATDPSGDWGWAFPVRDLVSRLRDGGGDPRDRSSERCSTGGVGLVARTRSGVVRGRPCPIRGADTWPCRTSSIPESSDLPVEATTTIGGPRPSTSWWILLVNPPRERRTHPGWSQGAGQVTCIAGHGPVSLPNPFLCPPSRGRSSSLATHCPNSAAFLVLPNTNRCEK